LPATSVSLREEGLRASIQQPLVNTVAFSPDGSRLVTGDFNQDGTPLAYPADDGTIRLLALDIDDLLALARSRLTRSWTEDECRSYLHLDRCPPALR
jgi:WD40 repeat protein